MAEERKLVTILFADVIESTELSETLDPEDVRALMADYFQHAQRVISEHGGALEKFIGDAVMAVFGLPQAHGNDAERALAAALALRDAVAGDGMLADRLQLRIGVNTGEVVATNEPSRGEFLVTGDAVNVAARLEQAAAPGEILASARAHAAAEAAMRFGTTRQIMVKGKREPLTVYPLLGTRPARLIGHPPLVGREPDLAQLALLRDRALVEQRPQLVSIVAPAGAGKTRLLEEFIARLPSQAGFHIATARCLPYGQELTYWPLRGLLEGLLGEAFTRQRVEAALVAGGHTHDAASRIAGLVLATLGVESEAMAEREQVFSAWRALLEALAREAPRVVVFEDLHWASDSLLDLVEYVMHPRTQAAILIISTSRPELLDRRPAWGGGRRSFTALALEPLSEAQTRTLVGALAGKLPDATRDQIVERSGGNPFFAIELTRAAAEQENSDAAIPNTTALLPDTVHEAVLARLDQLAPREKRILQAAAVVGRAFRPETLHALVSADAREDHEASNGADLRAMLDTLQERDLIAPVDAEAGAYAFRHILIRDVAYGALARSERVRMHAAVASWLEQFAANQLDQYIELIAYHYREAARIARQSAIPMRLPFDAPRAVRSLERAGEVASRVGAVLEARGHLEAAISLAPPEEHRRLYEELGDYTIYSDGALRAYEAALARWRNEGGDGEPGAGARLLRKILIIRTRWQGTVAHRLSEDEMEALRSEAWRLAEASDDEYERWRLRVVNLFWPFWHRVVSLDDEAYIRREAAPIAAYFEQREDWVAMSETLDGYCSMLQLIGAYEELTQVAQRRLMLPYLSYMERGDAGAMIAWARCYAGDYAESIAVARQTAATLGQGISASLLGNVASFGVLSSFLSGSWSQMREFVAKLEEAWEAIGRDAGAQYLWHGFAAALHVAKAHDDQPALARATAALRRINDAHPNGLCDRLLTAYLDDNARPLGNWREFHATVLAHTHADSAMLAIMFLSERGLPLDLDLLEQVRTHSTHSPMDAMTWTTAIAKALATDDNARIAAAVDDAEAHGLIPHAARMRVVLAQRTGDHALLERTRPVLEGLGDRQFLRWLDEVAAALT